MRKKDKYRYLYPILNEMSKRKFSETCRKIKRGVKGVKLEKTIEGIGYSQIKTYQLGELKIGVFNDEFVEAVYVCSDVDLSGVLGVESIC